MPKAFICINPFEELDNMDIAFMIVQYTVEVALCNHFVPEQN